MTVPGPNYHTMSVSGGSPGQYSGGNYAIGHNGYWCSRCGCWVGYWNYHQCAVPPVQHHTHTYFAPRADPELKELLLRLVDLLEKLMVESKGDQK